MRDSAVTVGTFSKVFWKVKEEEGVCWETDGLGIWKAQKRLLTSKS